MKIIDTQGNNILSPLVPIGAILAWHSTSYTPALPANFVQCNGQTLSDPASPFDGQVIPDLNGYGGSHIHRFVRGNTSSGATDGTVSKDVNVTGQLDGGSVSFCNGSGGSAAPQYQSLTASGSITDIQPPYIDMIYIMRIK